MVRQVESEREVTCLQPLFVMEKFWMQILCEQGFVVNLKSHTPLSTTQKCIALRWAALNTWDLG